VRRACRLVATALTAPHSHVILPKPLLKLIPKTYFDPEEPGVLRILSDAEWRGIGITQSLGWEHYEVHGESSRQDASCCGSLWCGRDGAADCEGRAGSELCPAVPHLRTLLRGASLSRKRRLCFVH
jgi:hypothetical protein